MTWDVSPAIEEFANADEKNVEDANAHSKNVDALMTLLLKGFRRYQTKLLIGESKAAPNLEKNAEVRL